MHNIYSDILERIAEPPIWFDDHAVPRWCAFEPERISYIYGRECALVHIECQSCRMRFDAAVSELSHRDTLWRWEIGTDPRTKKPAAVSKKSRTLADLIRDGSFRYGDPPNNRCCAAGPTMTALVIAVLEYWYKPVLRGEGAEGGIVRDRTALAWHRDFELEVPLSDYGR